MRISIQYKITALFTLVAAVLLFGLYAYLVPILQRESYARIESTLQKELAFSKQYIETYKNSRSSANQDMDALADTIGRVLSVRTTIITSDGVVVGDSDVPQTLISTLENHRDRPEISDAVTHGFGKRVRYSATVKKNMLYCAVSFDTASAPGVIRLSLPLTDIEHIERQGQRILWYAMGGAFLIALCLCFVVAFFVSRPIAEVTHVAQAIARGDFSRRCLYRSRDELGDLSAAITRMAADIQSRMQDVMAEKAKLEAVFASMVEGVIILNVKGTIILMNTAAKKMFQVSDEPDGKLLIEIVRDVEITDLAEKTYTDTQECIRREITMHIPEERTFLVQAAPVVSNGTMQGTVLVFHNITELKRLERVRRDFVANVSHELRTPVSNIKGYSETLLDGALDDRKHAKEFLEIICANTQRLIALIDDLLALSRIESSEIPLQRTDCRLSAIVQRAMSNFSKKAADKNIQCSARLPENLPVIKADETSLEQAINNLLDNAIKYTPAGGTITVSVSAHDNALHITVTDTGIGIPEKDLPRIFERFYRVDKGRSRTMGGTGLGLSIVKHIAQAHRGTVSVQSTLGHGSTFTITLPIA